MLPVAAAAGTAAWLCAWDARGSVAADAWLSTAIVVAAVLATVLAAAAVRPSRAALVSLAGLCALAVWTGLSLRWSPLPSLGRDETLLTVLYAAAFALPVVLLRTGAERLAAAGAVAAAASGVALATAVELATSGDAASAFAIGRLELPITYANAAAAVLLVGFWPCVAVAAAQGAPLVARALAVGGGALLLGGWLATQSKGGGIGLLVAAVLVFALSPARLRLAVPALLSTVCAGLAAVPLTEPFRADDAALADAAAGVGRALLLVAAVASVIGAAYAAADRRVELGARGRRIAARVAAIALAAALVAGAALVVASFGRPDRALADAWDAFSTYHDEDASAGTHLISLGGSNRYDFYRVALLGIRDDPVVGIGARGFQAEYLREGRSFETPARTHSLPLETLLELGAVGLVLLLVALVPALCAAGVAIRRGRLWGVAALGATAAWLAHASVDWTWTFPAAGLPFFLLLGIGASAGPDVPLRARTSALGAAATAAAAAVLFVPAWVSGRLVERAAERPASAAGALDLARRLDPVTVRPLLAEAELAGSLAPLEEAARREPMSVGVRYQLGVRLLDAGRRVEARRELEAALALAPGEPLIESALERANGGGG